MLCVCAGQSWPRRRSGASLLAKVAKWLRIADILFILLPSQCTLKKGLGAKLYHHFHLNSPLLLAGLCRLLRVEVGPDRKIPLRFGFEGPRSLWLSKTSQHEVSASAAK